MKEKDISQINSYIDTLTTSARPLAIFDLDSTLYNVSPRTAKIIQDFCLINEIVSTFPKETSQLKKTMITSKDWGYMEALERDDFIAPIKFLKKLVQFWRKHFFSNDYLVADEPYTKASDFVNKFISLNIKTIYLTGRSENKMQTGSLKKLQLDGFPINPTNMLNMKPNSDLLDHVFKSNFIANLKNNFDQILLFENEPKIINRINLDHPEVFTVFINSTHSRSETLKNQSPTIEMDYSKLL